MKKSVLTLFCVAVFSIVSFSASAGSPKHSRYLPKHHSFLSGIGHGIGTFFSGVGQTLGFETPHAKYNRV